MSTEWLPIESAPKDRPVYLKGPKGGKVRAKWIFGVMGVPGWYISWNGELVAYGSTHWQEIPRKRA